MDVALRTHQLTKELNIASLLGSKGCMPAGKQKALGFRLDTAPTQ